MKIGKLINMVVEKRADIMRRKNGKPSLVIYIDHKTWKEIMAELKGQMSAAAYSMYESMGNFIMGYKIYKVDDDNEHIKVFEE